MITSGGLAVALGYDDTREGRANGSRAVRRCVERADPRYASFAADRKVPGGLGLHLRFTVDEACAIVRAHGLTPPAAWLEAERKQLLAVRLP